MTETAISPFGPIASALADGSVVFDANSLTVLDPDLTFEVYESLFRSAYGVQSAAKFWIGDLINFGNGAYGERYAQALSATDYKYDYLRQLAYVCRHVAKSRRRNNLSWSHHAEVASLEPRVQVEWFDAAEENGWSVEQLRQELRAAKTAAAENGSGNGAVEPAEAAPATLSARQTIDATRSLASVRETLETTETLARSTGDATVLAGIPQARRELDTADAIVRLARTLPDLHEVVRRLLEDARPDAGDATFSVVSTELLDELRGLVVIEGSTA